MIKTKRVRKYKEQGRKFRDNQVKQFTGLGTYLIQRRTRDKKVFSNSVKGQAQIRNKICLKHIITEKYFYING